MEGFSTGTRRCVRVRSELAALRRARRGESPTGGGGGGGGGR